jgi:hypothetical protein
MLFHGMPTPKSKGRHGLRPAFKGQDFSGQTDFGNVHQQSGMIQFVYEKSVLHFSQGRPKNNALRMVTESSPAKAQICR